MKRLSLCVTTLVAALSLALVGCAQATPPAPTQAPAPPKAAEPAKAPAAAPAAPAAPTKAPEPAKAAEPAKAPEPTKAAAAPVKKLDYPEKGKSIAMVIPYAPGGGADLTVRLIAPALEKELGVPLELVNKAGAGSQVGIAYAAAAKPDGYTVGYASFPTVNIIYLDPERKATFGRKDFVPVALHLSDPAAVAVRTGSPWKTVKDVVDAAKAKPDQIKVGVSGMLSPEHLDFLQLQKQTGTKFAIVPFESAAPAVTAMLGEHIDIAAVGLSSVISSTKGNQSRVIGTFGPGGDKFLPGVKSMEEQGYKGFFTISRGYFLPVGTPKEIVDLLTQAMKKSMDTDDHRAKAAEIGQLVTYLDPAQFATYWDDVDAKVAPLMDLAKQATK